VSKRILFSLALILAGCGTAPPFTVSTLLGRGLAQTAGETGTPFRGAFHAHTRYSHDSAGSLKDVVRAARRAGLDFVVITDHNNLRAKSDPEVPKLPSKPLLIFGTEISTGAGHLIALGIEREILPPIGAQEAIDRIREMGGFAILAHPVCEKGAWREWGVKGFHAIEIYSYSCDFYGRNKAKLTFELLFLPPPLLAERVFREPRETLNRWDSLLQKEPVAAVGSVDAHVTLPFLGFHLMRYSLSFEAVTLYVFADSLSERGVIEAIGSGRSYIAFETRGLAKGFSFQAVREEQKIALVATLPQTAEIRLFRNGKIIETARAKTLRITATEPGNYRVEIFLSGKLWIVSNPILIEL
jgi:hypothetical protein